MYFYKNNASCYGSKGFQGAKIRSRQLRDEVDVASQGVVGMAWTDQVEWEWREVDGVSMSLGGEGS